MDAGRRRTGAASASANARTLPGGASRRQISSVRALLYRPGIGCTDNRPRSVKVSSTIFGSSATPMPATAQPRIASYEPISITRSTGTVFAKPGLEPHAVRTAVLEHEQSASPHVLRRTDARMPWTGDDDVVLDQATFDSSRWSSTGSATSAASRSPAITFGTRSRGTPVRSSTVSPGCRRASRVSGRGRRAAAVLSIEPRRSTPRGPDS